MSEQSTNPVDVFVQSLDNRTDILKIVLRVFDFIEQNPTLKEAIKVSDDKLSIVKKFLIGVIDNLWSNNHKLHEKYIDLVNTIFCDSYDIGTVITLLMKAVEEISLFIKMNGIQKKALVKTIFDKILEYSPLSQVEQELAQYAFSGVVEAVIFASKGGMKPIKDKCIACCY